MEKALSRMTEGLLSFMPRPLSRIAEKRMYVLKRETMLRVKILNVFRADYGVCRTIFIYPEEFVLSAY